MESVILGVLVGVITTIGIYLLDSEKHEYIDLFKIFLMTTISAVIVSYLFSFDYVKKLLVVGAGVGAAVGGKVKKIHSDIVDNESDAESDTGSEFTAKLPDF